MDSLDRLHDIIFKLVVIFGMLFLIFAIIVLVVVSLNSSKVYYSCSERGYDYGDMVSGGYYNCCKNVRSIEEGEGYVNKVKCVPGGKLG